ncbi:MAG: hypothetical protein M1828_003622 [Chrysothrix sp. TS-e1954]|nr:MAG: hypothetical protein M1828_003622 [Chrysothrix sp. TS-e1954]
MQSREPEVLTEDRIALLPRKPMLMPGLLNARRAEEEMGDTDMPDRKSRWAQKTQVSEYGRTPQNLRLRGLKVFDLVEETNLTQGQLPHGGPRECMGRAAGETRDGVSLLR